MKCLECGSELARGKADKYQFLESGLRNIFLCGIPVWKCKECEHEEIEIPDPIGLHRFIMKKIVAQDRPLKADEFRYLRTYLGLSSKDLADRFSITREQVSRWENDKTPISGPADSLIRYMAMVEKPIEDYSVIDLKKVIETRKRYSRLEATYKKDSWQEKSGT